MLDVEADVKQWLAMSLPLPEQAGAGGMHSAVICDEKQWNLLGSGCSERGAGI